MAEDATDLVADEAEAAPLFAPVLEFARPPEVPLAAIPALIVVPLGAAVPTEWHEGEEAAPELGVATIAGPAELAQPRTEGANPAALPQAAVPGLAVPLAPKGGKPARAEGQPEADTPMEPGAVPVASAQAVPVAEPLAVPPAPPVALAAEVPPKEETALEAQAAPRHEDLPTPPLRPRPPKADLMQRTPAAVPEPAPAAAMPKPAAAVPVAPPVQADADTDLIAVPLAPSAAAMPAPHEDAAPKRPALAAVLKPAAALTELTTPADPAVQPPAAALAPTEVAARPHTPVAPPPSLPHTAPLPEAALNMRQADWGRQLLDRVERASRDGSELFEISLRPKTLGALRITLEVQGERTSVHFVTETGAAARMLLGSEDKLSQLLDQSGFRLGGFSAQGGSAGGQSGQPQPQKDRLPVRAGKRPTATAPQSAPVQGAAGAGVNVLA